MNPTQLKPQPPRHRQPKLHPIHADPAVTVAEQLRHGYWLRIGAGRQRPSVRHFLDYCETGILQYYLSLQPRGGVSLAQFRSRVSAILFQRLLGDARQKGILAVRLQKTLLIAAPLLKKSPLPTPH